MRIDKYDIHQFIQTVRVPAREGTPDQASPFNLRFRARDLSPALRSSITGTCIYVGAMDDRVFYLGKYQPMNGNIINDRFARHLQTVTGRGADIGFGGRNNPGQRLQRLLAGVSDEHLRSALVSAYETDRWRFKDTGCNTSPNRLRFASACWAIFGTNDQAILNRLSFTLIRMAPAAGQAEARRRISLVEQRLLGEFQPLCNANHRPAVDGAPTPTCTVERVLQVTRAVMFDVTREDAHACTTLGA